MSPPGFYQSNFIAGHVFGQTGIFYTIGSPDVTVLAGGSVTGTAVAIILGGASGSINNSWTMAGDRGIFASGNLSLNNAVQIQGRFDSVVVEGNATVVNTGTLSGNTAIIVNGQADISNYGTIFGGIATRALNDIIINRGLITGTVTTGDGDDLIDGIGGRFEKQVILGSGNDTF